MFQYLGSVGAELHAQMISVYWILIVPFVLLLFTLEFLKEENPDIRGILRRIVISVIMLYSFNWCLSALASLGDAVTDQINGLEPLSHVLKNLGPNYSGHDNWFNLRDTVIYIFSLAAYLIAYVGFFTATALTHFVWTILYVCSPLMILMYVSPATAHVTGSLYKGVIQVVIWKILWSILGVLLLKLAMQPNITGLEDYLMAIVMNLCIGVSMLFIPLTTRSLISDGMNSVANTLAMAPAIATAGAVKLGATTLAAKSAGGAASAAGFAAKPVINPLSGRYQLAKERLQPRFEQMKKTYSQINLPKELKDRDN